MNIPADALRQALRGKNGSRLWQSLDEFAASPGFAEFAAAELSLPAPAIAALDRRAMLKAMGAAFALAGLTGCDGEPDDKALPYVRAPEFVVPGNPVWYATAVTFAGYAQPVLGKTHTGRPVKLEGNPDHPATAGGTDAFTQAALLNLYDPERSQQPRHRGRPTSWPSLVAALHDKAADLDRRRGEGFRIVTGATTSPTLVSQVEALLARWPEARWHSTEPVSEARRRDASRDVFGQTLATHYMLQDAEVVVSMADDFLGPGPHQVAHATRWSQRRLAFQQGDGASRLFVAEPVPTPTGAMAERRLVLSPDRLPAIVRALAAGLGLDAGNAAKPSLSEEEQAWLTAAIGAIATRPGRALFTVGPQQDAGLQATMFLINERIGALNSLLRMSRPVIAMPDGDGSIEALVRDMQDGQVSAMAILGANPAFATPTELGFAEALRRVDWRMHAGLHYDETARLCDWHAPLAHDLESWSDAAATDGTVSLIQPLVRPFYPVRPLHSVIAALTGDDRDASDIVRATWQAQWGPDLEVRWQKALIQGYVEGSAPAFLDAVPATKTIRLDASPAESASGYTAVLLPDAAIWDGRYVHNAWLQETPRPLNKVTWGNVIGISPHLARHLKLRNGDEVELARDDRRIAGPVWVTPGQAEDAISLTLGYGKADADAAAPSADYDAFQLQAADGAWLVPHVALRPTGRHLIVASTQRHQAMDGFDFVRTVSRDAPDAAALGNVEAAVVAEPRQQRAPSFYPPRRWDSPSWGMSVDLDLCIGCNACVVACVAENNIAMVGKDLVAQGREMHWLRIDRYYEGDPARPKSHFQPVPCMHCEQAPCEMGCPVNAAVHSSDGLNLQVYNRCIGTRTCSSYCPYKVRHFNWFDYTGDDSEELQAARNPDVTVRDRGVMEKCTYCVQRISEARICAEKAGRAIADGEIRTACEQACPTKAIVFGNVMDPESAVSRRKSGPRDYSLLEEANTWPRTTYLARLAATDPDGPS